MLQSIRDGDRLIVRIDGELDHFCAQSVRRDLDALLLDRSVRTLILDFSSLTFMDSSGIGVVLGRYRLLRDRGGHVFEFHAAIRCGNNGGCRICRSSTCRPSGHRHDIFRRNGEMLHQPVRPKDRRNHRHRRP